MLEQFLYTWNPWLVPLGLFLLLGLTVELAYKYGGALPLSSFSDDAWSATQSGIVTLVAFTVGLSFAQSLERFDGRRVLVIREANAIRTTWLRAENLPYRESAIFRQELMDYTATRLAAYQQPADPSVYERAVARSDREQEELWSTVQTALHKQPGDLGLALLMQALNDTINLAAEQLQAFEVHVPLATVVMTILLAWFAALSLGLRFARNKSRPFFMSMLNVVAYTLVLTMIIDYDRTQSGLVKVSLAPIAIQLQSMQLGR